MFTCNGDHIVTDVTQADISMEEDMEESVQRVPILGKSKFPSLPGREDPKPLVFISYVES